MIYTLNRKLKEKDVTIVSISVVLTVLVVVFFLAAMGMGIVIIYKFFTGGSPSTGEAGLATSTRKKKI